MPNHVTHIFSVEGKTQDISKFIEKCFDNEGEFDFNALIPMPKILEKTISGNTAEMQTDEYKAIEKTAVETTGHANWYSWRLENWGTKWNAYHTQLNHQDDFLELTFDTAWSCPEPIFQSLSEQFPSLKFKGYALDEGYCFGAEININSDNYTIDYLDINPGFLEAFSHQFD